MKYEKLGNGGLKFALDGTRYEIDLSAAHATELRAILGRYVQAARKTSSPRRAARAARKPAVDGVGNAQVRAWAKAEGIQINDRGRIPRTVIDKYRATAAARKVMCGQRGQRRTDRGAGRPGPVPAV